MIRFICFALIGLFCLSAVFASHAQDDAPPDFDVEGQPAEYDEAEGWAEPAVAEEWLEEDYPDWIYVFSPMSLALRFLGMIVLVIGLWRYRGALCGIVVLGLSVLSFFAATISVSSEYMFYSDEEYDGAAVDTLYQMTKFAENLFLFAALVTAGGMLFFGKKLASGANAETPSKPYM